MGEPLGRSPWRPEAPDRSRHHRPPRGHAQCALPIIDVVHNKRLPGIVMMVAYSCLLFCGDRHDMRDAQRIAAVLLSSLLLPAAGCALLMPTMMTTKTAAGAGLLHLEEPPDGVRPRGDARDGAAGCPLHVVEHARVAEYVPCSTRAE